MTDDNGTVVPFPTQAERQAAEDQVAAAREAHLEAFRNWLKVARPTRDDAELEGEVFAATARQMVLRYTSGAGT